MALGIQSEGELDFRPIDLDLETEEAGEVDFDLNNEAGGMLFREALLAALEDGSMDLANTRRSEQQGKQRERRDRQRERKQCS